MNCNCRIVQKEITSLDKNISQLQAQLQQCEMCAYKKDVPQHKKETYKTVRLKYVEAFWQEHRPYTTKESCHDNRKN